MKHQVLINAVILLLLVACKQLVSYPTNTPTATMPEVMTMVTIQALNLKTPGSIEYVQNQVSDGGLLLSIHEVKNECHRFDEAIFIDLVFQNLTTESLMLLDVFEVAVNRRGEGGNIRLLISEGDGTPLSTRADYLMADFFWVPTPSYHPLPPNEDYQIRIDFIFPNEKVVAELQDYLEIAPTNPGNYLIRLLYSVYEKGDSWSGTVASNQISICVK